MMKTKPTAGSYILLLKLPSEQTLTVGRLPARYFPRGYYAYVGSGMGGLEARINRHFRNNKKLHWHIDYILKKAYIIGIFLCEADNRMECAITQSLSHQFDWVPGFGCSDCRCRSHLFFDANERHMKKLIIVTLNSLSIQARLVRKLAQGTQSPAQPAFTVHHRYQKSVQSPTLPA